MHPCVNNASGFLISLLPELELELELEGFDTKDVCTICMAPAALLEEPSLNITAVPGASAWGIFTIKVAL